MNLLQCRRTTSPIALWLGHASTRATTSYLHADLAIKERALARTQPQRHAGVATAPPTTCSPSWNPRNYAGPHHPARDRGSSQPVLGQPVITAGPG